jgi:glycosyltransferase involved in cell wall biosynthesis
MPAPDVCLIMIVCNEAGCITDTLREVLQSFKVVTWVICDTGSTDGTQDLVRQFFHSHDMPGVLVQHTWQDFGTNRTLAMRVARERAPHTYGLMWDADDSVEGLVRLPFAATPGLLPDMFLLTMTMGSYIFQRACLFSLHIDWKFEGVLHEYPARADNKPETKMWLPPMPAATDAATDAATYCIRLNHRKGHRSMLPDGVKFGQDAAVLLRALEDCQRRLRNPDLRSEERHTVLTLKHRYAFYCANAFKDSGDAMQAVAMYRQVLHMSEAWVQERYMAAIYAFDLSETAPSAELGPTRSDSSPGSSSDPQQYTHYLVAAWSLDPTRAESVARLVRVHCGTGQGQVALKYLTWAVPAWDATDWGEDRVLASKLFACRLDYRFYLPLYALMACGLCNDFRSVLVRRALTILGKFRVVGVPAAHIATLFEFLALFLREFPGISASLPALGWVTYATDIVAEGVHEHTDMQSSTHALQCLLHLAGHGRSSYTLKTA